MKKSRILLGSLVSMIGFLTLSISLSLAWYASSAQLYIDTLNIDLEMDRELLISTKKNGTYKNKLVQGVDDIKEVDLFTPVSSMKSDEWLENREIRQPFFYDCSSPLLSSVTHKYPTPYLEPYQGGFYTQSFWLKCERDSMVTLSVDDVLPSEDPTLKDKTSIVSNREANQIQAVEIFKEKHNGQSPTEDDKPEVDKIVDGLNNLENCIRLSVLTPGPIIKDDATEEEKAEYDIKSSTDTLDPIRDKRDYAIYDPHPSGEKTCYAGVLDNAVDEYYDVGLGQDGKQYEVVYGNVRNRDNLVYSADPLAQDTDFRDPDSDPSAFNAKSKQGAHTFDKEASLLAADIEVENALTDSDLAGDHPKFMIPVVAHQPKEIVISLYLEGWDEDSINETMAGHFNATLAFKIARDFIG